MELLLEEAYNANRSLTRPLEQGDCAHLQGYIKNFHDKREITAFRICILSRLELTDYCNFRNSSEFS